MSCRRRAWQRVLRCRFDKSFHVSPFNPMEMHYDWRSNTPGERLAIHLENHSAARPRVRCHPGPEGAADECRRTQCRAAGNFR
jgi:DUF1365 family protein